MSKNPYLTLQDRELCMKILENWLLNLQDINGYIAREQVRGEEISSRVPYGFVEQDGQEANPPTLLLPLNMLLKDLKSPNT